MKNSESILTFGSCNTLFLFHDEEKGTRSVSMFPLYAMQRSFQSRRCQSICDKTWKLSSWFARDIDCFILFYFVFCCLLVQRNIWKVLIIKKKKKSINKVLRRNCRVYFNFVFSVSFPYQLRETEIHFVYSVGFPYERKETERKLKGFV